MPRLRRPRFWLLGSGFGAFVAGAAVMLGVYPRVAPSLGLAPATPAAAPACGPGRTAVVSVHDGDTLTVQGGTRVRVLGIDTPELDDARPPWRALALAARDRARALLADGTVCLTLDRDLRDRYGRTLAHVYLADGRWLAELLVAEGLARVYRKASYGGRERLDAVEAEARRAGRGLWALSP